MTFSIPADLKAAFPPRPLDSHKYSVGTVTVVGGSSHFISAPAIAALGARAGGAGLVQLVVPDATRLTAAALVPEATYTKLGPTCVFPRADVTVVGMGLGVSASSEVVVSKLLSGSSGRFILDADALSVLANWYAAKHGYHPTPGQTLVLTPHAGEAARLLACKAEDVQKDRPAAARRIVERYRAIVVLKGAHTLVAAPDTDAIFTCPAGNPFMALGGMGDLLSGLLAARWAYLAHARDAAEKKTADKAPPRSSTRHLSLPPLADETAVATLAASAAVWLHAAASDRLVAATPPVDPSVVHTAAAAASFRVELERS